MPRQTNRQLIRITSAQRSKAERFRALLLEYNDLRDEEKEFFENFIDSLDAVQLTNLSRQYRAPLETYYDSHGVTTILARDLLRRIQHLIKQQSANVYAAAAREIIDDKDTRRDIQTPASLIFRAYSKYRELREIEDTTISRQIGLYEELWDRARTDADRQLVLQAAEGKVWYMSNREFFKHFRVGKEGVKRYREIILNAYQARRQMDQE